MNERTRVPVAVLPIDLLVAVRNGANLDVRRHPTSKPTGRFALALPAAIGLLVLGALEALTVSDASAFGFGPRWVGLLFGGALLGAWLVWRSIPRFAPERGHGMIIGDASLVIIGERWVEVLPAESLAVTSDGIVSQGETIDDGFRERAWTDKLKAVIEHAKTDAGARAGDRFRQAAARAKSARPETTLDAWKPVLAGAGAFFLAAVFLEAGPFGARGSAALAGTKASFESARRSADALATAAAAPANAAPLLAAKASQERAQMELEQHRKALEAALHGKLEDARAFLSNSANRIPSEVEKVEHNYEQLATAALKDAQTTAEILPILDDCQRYGFTEEFVKRAHGRFTTLAGPELSATRDPDVARAFVLDQQAYGLDESFGTKARARWHKLAADAALAGGIDDVRRYLDDPEFADAAERDRVEARINSLCGSFPKTGEDAFYGAILQRLCVEQSKEVVYEVTESTDKELGRKAATAFARDLAEVAARAGQKKASFVARQKTRSERATIRVSVVEKGRAKPTQDDPLLSEVECTIVVMQLDATGAPRFDSVHREDATCRKRASLGGVVGGQIE